jgi:hypothetical protein
MAASPVGELGPESASCWDRVLGPLTGLLRLLSSELSSALLQGIGSWGGQEGWGDGEGQQ